MELLKLIALDEEDLRVVSAHLQDALVRTEDMVYMPQDGRFALLMNRFDWLGAVEDHDANGSGYQRRQCALRFEKVKHVQYRKLSLAERSEMVELLAVSFEAGETPSGSITLNFVGGGGIRLHVDCIEAELRDLGPSFKTPQKPTHFDDLGEPKSAS